jgi:hypothetical protein
MSKSVAIGGGDSSSSGDSSGDLKGDGLSSMSDTSFSVIPVC